MSHLSDADLVLYRQDEAPDRQRIEEHLSTCERCRTELSLLDRVLQLVEADAAPDRGADYGTTVWEAIEDRLDEPSPPRRLVWPLAWGVSLRAWVPQAALAAAVAVLLAVVFQGGAGGPGVPASVRDPVLVAAVEDHLERTGLMLADLNNAAEVIEVRGVNARAEDLASDNRLYRQSAALAGDEPIRRLLDDLERMLLEVAHQPDDPDDGEAGIEALRGRLDTRGLAYQVRLASAELRARAGETEAAAGL